MENDPYTRGLFRNIKFNLIAGIVLAILATIINLIACSPVVIGDGEQELSNIIEDWPDAIDTITTTPDSVRDMTHADSIRFGLITPDK